MKAYIFIASLLLLILLITIGVDVLVALGVFYVPIPLLLAVSILLKSWLITGGVFLWIQLLQLYRKVEIDFLTKAKTREVLFRELRILIESQGGQRAKEAFALIVFDIDNFKCINDELGHKIGDEVLMTISQKVRDTVRQTDIFARTGGEEFAIILPRTALDEAARLAERLRVRVHAPLMRSCQISASFGVSVWNGMEAVDEFYDRVDALMYEAKRAGKNTVIAQ